MAGGLDDEWETGTMGRRVACGKLLSMADTAPCLSGKGSLVQMVGKAWPMGKGNGHGRRRPEIGEKRCLGRQAGTIHFPACTASATTCRR